MKTLLISMLSSVLLVVLWSDAPAGRARISTEVAQSTYTEKDIEQEIKFGREMAAIILANHQMMDNTELNYYLNLVGHSILQHASRQEIPFHFAVINSSAVNAYAAPGGYIFITRTALSLMENEAELAGVLAHEIAHVTQRHIVKALKIKASDDSVAGSIGRVVGSTGSSANVVFDQAVGKAIEILFSKGLQQEDEFNADEVGIILTALAGYDPTPYYEYLQRIKPLVEKPGAELGKTHPPITVRLKRLRKIITSEGLDQLEGAVNIARFKKIAEKRG